VNVLSHSSVIFGEIPEWNEKLAFLEEILARLPGCIQINQVAKNGEQLEIVNVFSNGTRDIEMASEAIHHFRDDDNQEIAVNILHSFTGSGDPIKTLIKSRVFRRNPDGTPCQFLNWIVDLSRDLETDHQIGDLIREVHRLRNRLAFQRISGREKEILSLISTGMSAKMISERLNISIHTVCTHRKNLLRKLDLHNIAALAAFAATLGI
jgi:DNA-binding CsgD family transcriptional regulator